MLLKDNIKKWRTTAKLTQEQLGKKLGVGKSTISMYESGERVPPVDIIYKLCQVFNTDMNTLCGRTSSKSHTFISYASNDETSKIRADLVQFVERRRSNIIPIVGDVAAGIPIEAITDIIDYEEISPDLLKDGSEYFGLRIKGDSMEPKISDGDVVIVRKQADVDSGQIAIVCVNGDQATCKKVMKQESGILLVANNPTYPPVFYSNEQIETIPITILGKVVELRAKF